MNGYVIKVGNFYVSMTMKQLVRGKIKETIFLTEDYTEASVYDTLKVVASEIKRLQKLSRGRYVVCALNELEEQKDD